MPNLRIIHVNHADQATSLSASTTSGSLAASLMQTDRKGEAHRSTGTSVTYTATWTGGVSIGAVALPATNLSAAATIRVRLYSDTACTALLQDTGAITACPGLSAGPWTWTGTFNANAFAYGYLSKAVAWLAANLAGVKGLKVDLVDTGNPAGYIDCSRLIAGPWWSPDKNAAYGPSHLVADNTVNTRGYSGDLNSDRSTMHEELTFSMQEMGVSDREAVVQIMVANGAWKPIFVSLLPLYGDSREQRYMVYGKMKPSPVVHPVFETFKTDVNVEGW